MQIPVRHMCSTRCLTQLIASGRLTVLARATLPPQDVREYQPGLRRHFRALVEAPPRRGSHWVPTFNGNIISTRCAVHAFSDPSSWTRWRSSGQVKPVRQSSRTSLMMLNSIVSSIAERASSTRHPGSRPCACPDLVSLRCVYANGFSDRCCERCKLHSRLRNLNRSSRHSNLANAA